MKNTPEKFPLVLTEAADFPGDPLQYSNTYKFPGDPLSQTDTLFPGRYPSRTDNSLIDNRSRPVDAFVVFIFFLILAAI